MTPAEGEENAETKDSEMLGETKRPASSAQNTGESPDKKRANKQPDRGVSSTTEYQGYSFVDCGGTGDCAYRALAVAYALQDQRDQKEAVAAAKQLGATLRAQMSSHLKKYDHFKESFAVDPRWTENQRGWSRTKILPGMDRCHRTPEQVDRRTLPFNCRHTPLQKHCTLEMGWTN